HGLLAVAGGEVSAVTDSVAVRRVAEGPDGALWIATDTGLLRLSRTSVRGAEKTPESVSLPASADPVDWIEVDEHSGTVWVGGSGGLYRRTPWSSVWERVGEDRCDMLLLDPRGVAWSASGTRVLREGALVADLPGEAQSLQDDDEGNIWVSTTDGFVRLQPALAVVRDRDADVSSVVSDAQLAHSREGRERGFWYASGASVHHVTPDSDTVYDIGTGVQSLCSLRDGSVFVATGGAVSRRIRSAAIPGQPSEIEEFEVPGLRRVFSFGEGENGDLWAAGFGTIGLHRNGEWRIFGTADGVSAGPMRYGQSTESGDVWFTTPEGALRWHDETFRLYTEADGLPSLRTRSVYVDERGVVWIGTEGTGLVRLTLDASGDVTRLTHVREQDGLQDNGVNWIGGDPEGRLWFASNRGVYHVLRSELDAFAESEVDRIHSSVYTEEHGLASSVCASPGTPAGAILGPDVLFATASGVAAIDRRDIGDEAPPPKPIIEEVLVDGTSQPTNGAASLASDAHDFEITYTTTSFTDPHGIRFRYRIDGVQERWIDAGTRRTAYFTSIPAGRHLFRVQAARSAGEWSDAETVFQIEVAPHFWETLWFRALVVLSIVASVLGAFQWRMRLSKRRERELELLIGKRTKELADQTRRLEELDQAKSRFFANVSHEFRTPLTLAIGPLEDLLSGLHGEFEDGAKQEIRTALRSSHAVLDLVNQILDLAKLESGQFRLELGAHDFVSTMRGVAVEFAPLAERRAVTLEVELPDGPLVVSHDPQGMERVFRNLLSNAFKFTPPGGSVAIGLAIPPAERGKTPAHVIGWVRDSGVGSPEADQGRIFDRFYQAPGNTRAEPGTGIGLSLAREIVELHHGRITLESTEGVGTMFLVEVPVRQIQDALVVESGAVHADNVAAASGANPDAASAANLDAASGAEVDAGPALGVEPVSTNGTGAIAGSSGAATGDGAEARGGAEARDGGAVRDGAAAVVGATMSAATPAPVPEDRTTVLIAEDNPDVRALVVKHLAPHYRILQATNGSDALRVARSSIPDLIVSDVMMPEMDGMELCRRLKADTEVGFIPVLLLTARADVTDRIDAYALGADAYLSKPFDSRELVARVDGLIRERRRLRGHYASKLPQVDNEKLRSADEVYLESITRIIYERLSDEEFSVERLAHEAGQTRATLFRRLKETAGTTPRHSSVRSVSNARAPCSNRAPAR
ncbi:MAG: response regulator, partial [Candidatus Eisenbacteria bacterium]